VRVLPGISAADVDYESVVAYHRHGTAIRRAPYLIAFACILLLVKTGADLATVRGDRFRPPILLVCAAVTAALALWWVRGRMPRRCGSVAFVAIADIVVLVPLVMLPPSSMIVVQSVLLLAVGNYASAFHGLRVYLVHSILVLGATTALVLRALAVGSESLVVVAATAVVIAFVVYGGSTLNHVFFTQLRDDAVRAYHDQLTGLRNRLGLLVDVEKQIHDAAGTPVAVSILCIDLDAFKSINDRHGHAAGDEVLRRAAGRIAAVAGDAVSARTGGEEFALVVVGVGDPGPQMASALLDAIHRPDDPTPVTASIGVATVPLPDGRVDTRDLLDTVLASADRAMYEAKRCGGHRAAVATGDDAHCL
jgi:diguanylate cyclase (GGDEF)-like protein